MIENIMVNPNVNTASHIKSLVVKITCRVATQHSFYNLTLLCRAALPGLTGDVVVAGTLAAV